MRFCFSCLCAVSLMLCAHSCALAATSSQGDDFEHGVKAWEFSNGPEFPGAKGSLESSADAAHDGKLGARIHYDFTGGGAYVGIYLDLKKLARLSAVEFWVRKPGPAVLTFRATDSTGQTCQKGIRFRYSGWQKVRVRMDRWSFSWGGAGDRVIHQPVKRIGLLVEKRGLPANLLKGVVDVDEVKLIANGREEESATRCVEYIVTDYADGRTVSLDFSKEKTLSLGLDGSSLYGHVKEIRFHFVRTTIPVQVELECASHFQHFARDIGTLQPGDRQTLSVAPPPEGWRHFGGENDGRLHGPIRILRLGFFRAGEKKVGSTILKQITCVTDVDTAQPVVLIPQHKNENGTDVLVARLQNLLPEKMPGKLLAAFRDENGIECGRRERRLVLPGRGVTERVAIDPPDKNFLCYDITLRFVDERGENRSDTVSAGLARGIAGKGSPKLQPGSPWGMGVYLYRYPDTPEGLGLMDRAAAMAQAAGVKWSREEILWHRTEPERGRFDFRFYDKVVACALRHGISVYGLLDYWSSWTKPYTEEGIEDYCRWVRRVVEHYKDRIHHWEIWNEPNIFFWSGPKELYPVLLKRAYATIKEVDPAAQVLGCSTSGIDSAFIRRCMAAGAPFDVLTIHPYRGTLDDLRFMNELQQVRELVGGREVWITEMGWPTQIGGVSELEQAQLLARCYLCSVASGAVQNVSWYDFREDGTDPFYNEHHFGALRHDLLPKAAYRALATVCNTLGVVKRTEMIEAPEGILACHFSSADRPETTVVWSTRQGATVALSGVEGTVTARSLVGRDQKVNAANGRCCVYVPPRSPVFLIDCVPRKVELVFALRRSDQAFRAGSAAPLKVLVHNPFGQRMSGEILFSLPKGWKAEPIRIDCAPGKAQELAAKIHVPAGEAGWFAIEGVVSTAQGTLRATETVQVLPEVLER